MRKAVFVVRYIAVLLQPMTIYTDCSDVPGVRSSEDVWSLRFTADTSRHALLTTLSLEICGRRKVRQLCALHSQIHTVLFRPAI